MNEDTTRCPLAQGGAMAANKHRLFALVGPDGSRKKELIKHVVGEVPGLEIFAKHTTRLWHAPDDTVFYRVTGATRQRLVAAHAAKQTAAYVEFEGQVYAIMKTEIDAALAVRHQILALSDAELDQLRAAGYEVIAIKVEMRPDGDDARRLPTNFQYAVFNDPHSPNSIAPAVRELEGIITSAIHLEG